MSLSSSSSCSFVPCGTCMNVWCGESPSRWLGWSSSACGMSTGSLAVVDELEVLVWPVDSDSPEKAEGCESGGVGQRENVQE